jgi:hypothetical protein
MTTRVLLACVCALIGVSAVAMRAYTQADPMGQGQAAINVRSDVKLDVKGTGGTPGERLQKLGQAVADQMPEIRACYRKQTANAPEIAGGLRLKLMLEENGKPKVEITNTDVGANELIKCVSKVLQNAPYKDVGRPAAALLKLEFDNSRAKGQVEMNAKQAEKSQVAVQDRGDGAKQASWSTEGDEVRFTVTAEPGAPAGTVELVMRGFHSGYAGFLDCRRKCEKGGVSPEGDIEAQLTLDKNGKPKVMMGKITVTHERAPVCGAKAFSRTKFEKPPAPIKAQILVHFAK